MESHWPATLQRDPRTFWTVALLGCLFFALTNLPWHLDDYDQAKQAFTSFEMVKEGHWLYQHTPRAHVATKPPLVGWVSAGLYEVTRSWDLAWRLPSLAAALVLALCLARAAIAAYGAPAGLLTMVAFMFNLLSPRLATLVRTDMPLALVLSLLGLAIWRHIRLSQPWSARQRFGLFLLLTAGMLIKGPIVYAFLLPGIVFFQWWRRKSGAPSAWFGWWPWIGSLAIFLVWAVGGIRFVPGFYDQVVMREFVGRFGETIHRPQPLYFYLPHLLHKFAPWSVLLFVFAWLLRKIRTGDGTLPAPHLDADVMWLLCWSLGGLIVMSCVPSKRVDRIFPVIPPLCLLLGAQMKKLLSNEQQKRRAEGWAMAALFLALLFTGGYSVFKAVTGYRGDGGALVEFGARVREEAAIHHWRYQAVTGSDEGMLLYLDQSHFAETTAAIAAWNAGQLDALVMPSEDVPRYLSDLQGPATVVVKSAQRAEHPGTYVLLKRGRGDDAPASASEGGAPPADVPATPELMRQKD